MDKTAVQPFYEELQDLPPKKLKPVSVWRMLRRVLALLASLELTVVLFTLSLVLVFLGTLAQMDEGIWTVLNHYFRATTAWIPFQVFVRFGQVFLGVPATATWSGRFPFPGGWLLGGLLLTNLLAAHAVRFRFDLKRVGILLIHSGLVVMMVSEFVTGTFAVEGRMTLEPFQSSNYIEDYHATELAVVDSANPKTDDVVVVPGSLLRDGGAIHHEALPFDVEVVRYMRNSTLVKLDPTHENPATTGVGLEALGVERPEVSGTDPDGKVDAASAYLTLKRKDTGAALGTYLLSVLWLEPQAITIDGKRFDLNLRFKRTYKDYIIQLLEFNHKVYQGTDTPKDFSSKVRVLDAAGNEQRQVVISMNDPLQHEGETFYQQGFLPGDRGTILQVVRNPGWFMPYMACTMVSLGMLGHFVPHLITFLRRRVAR